MASRRRKPRPKKPSAQKLEAADSSSRSARADTAAIVELVKDLPDSAKIELVNQLTVSRVETTFAGPLPTPDDFHKYSEVLPDAPDRIMRMAEREQQIRAEGQEGDACKRKAENQPGSFTGDCIACSRGNCGLAGTGRYCHSFGAGWNLRADHSAFGQVDQPLIWK